MIFLLLFTLLASITNLPAAQWEICYARMEKNRQITDSATYFRGATLLMCALTEVPKNYD